MRSQKLIVPQKRKYAKVDPLHLNLNIGEERPNCQQPQLKEMDIKDEIMEKTYQYDTQGFITPNFASTFKKRSIDPREKMDEEKDQEVFRDTWRYQYDYDEDEEIDSSEDIGDVLAMMTHKQRTYL